MTPETFKTAGSREKSFEVAGVEPRISQSTGNSACHETTTKAQLIDFY